MTSPQRPMQITPYPPNFNSNQTQPYAPNLQGGQTQNGFAANSPTGGLAPSGTNPQANMEFWQGAPVQQQQTAANGFGTPPSSGVNPWGPAPSPTAPSGLDLDRLAKSLQPSAGIEQTVYQPDPSTKGNTSAIQAAAQLGMSAGPGSLFPVVAGDSGATNSPNAAQTPSFAPRFGGEIAAPPQHQFSAPPQYPNPSNQFPSGASNSSGEWRFGAPPTAWSANSAPPQSSSPPIMTGTDSSVSIAPSSPANNWARPTDGWASPTTGSVNWPQSNNGSTVVQASGASSPWGQSSVRSADALDSFQSEMNAGGNARAAASTWGNSATSTSGPRPYSGNWPSGNSQPMNNAAGGAAMPSTLPAWNGASAANGPGQNSFGSSTGSAEEAALPQWPFAPQR
jgi:hypothetical protein